MHSRQLSCWVHDYYAIITQISNKYAKINLHIFLFYEKWCCTREKKCLNDEHDDDVVWHLKTKTRKERSLIWLFGCRKITLFCSTAKNDLPCKFYNPRHYYRPCTLGKGIHHPTASHVEMVQLDFFHQKVHVIYDKSKYVCYIGICSMM